MIFFDTIDFTKAVHNNPNLFKKISVELTPINDISHSETAKKFILGVNNYDNDIINKMLEEAMCKYLHVEFLPEGIENFCQKYNIPIDFSTMTTKEIILTIDNHKQLIG